MADTFGPTQRLQKAYEAAIGKIVKRILPPKQQEESLEDWLHKIAERSQAADVQEASDLLARKMVHWVNVKNSESWRVAASQSQRSRELYKLLSKEMQGATGIALQRLIQENAKLISSLPLHAASMVTAEVRKAQQAGARPGTVAKMLSTRFPQLLRSRVNLISRTETAKASTALTQARCSELDIDFYQWLTSKDQRVRDSHRNMHMVIVPWSQAPDPEDLFGEKSSLGHYHSGECPNCRCTQRVILTLDDIKFPARVYWNNAIHMMTKQVFINTVAPQLERRAAA